MCQIITMHVEKSDYRYIGQCEHGTVFVNWQFCSWHLSPTDFLKLAAFLELAVSPAQQDAREVQAQPLCLYRDQQGMVRLWFGTSAMAFKPQDWLEFTSMVELGLPKVSERLLMDRVQKQRLIPSYQVNLN